MINFKKADPERQGEDIISHYNWLTGINSSIGHTSNRSKHPNYPNHYCVDVIGKELVWMNESFPKESYDWYLWFESIFLVPEDMYSVLLLRWAGRPEFV